MNITVNIQLGLRGYSGGVRPLWLDMRAVGAISSWAGSYHILEMGQHYEEYVVISRLPTLPVIQGIPLAHPYERLTGKIRATGVTGNIGEAIAAIFARRYLGAQLDDIAHIRPRRPFRRRRAPDYLMRLSLNRFVSIFPLDIFPLDIFLSWPDWLPVESKARHTEASSAAGQKEALRQLVTYWSLLALSKPDVVGYGMIITFTYQPPREVRACLLLPQNQRRLVSMIQDEGDNVEMTRVRECLYAC